MKRSVRVRLLHDGTQPGAPLDEPLRFGLQDTKGEVHAGSQEGALRRFDFVIELKNGETESPVFAGSFVHGPPAGRFLYLSWKREGTHAAPWGWRIKVPLSGIGWTEVADSEHPGMCIGANVTGRRPHTTDPVNWQIQPS